jgi:hypothetical protein
MRSTATGLAVGGPEKVDRRSSRWWLGPGGEVPRRLRLWWPADGKGQNEVGLAALTRARRRTRGGGYPTALRGQLDPLHEWRARGMPWRAARGSLAGSSACMGAAHGRQMGGGPTPSPWSTAKTPRPSVRQSIARKPRGRQGPDARATRWAR